MDARGQTQTGSMRQSTMCTDPAGGCMAHMFGVPFVCRLVSIGPYVVFLGLCGDWFCGSVVRDVVVVCCNVA